MTRVGIIGCGKIARVRHIPEYMENPDAQIAGYYDIYPGRAEELAEKFGGKAYASKEEMLQDESIQAVSICTANQSHAADTIQALKAGKHVLCEKPMAVTLEDCIAMTQAAKENHRKLMIGQNQRLVRTHQKAKELIENGALGRILSFRTTFGHGGPETWGIDKGVNIWFFDQNKAGMGAMADLGIHKTDLIQYLLGTYVVETMAKVLTLDKRDENGRLISVDDNAICIYTMANGVVGTMTASWTYYGAEDNSTVIYGEKGILRIYDDPASPMKLILRDGGIIKYELDEIQTNDKQSSTGIIDAFISCIENNTEPAISGDSVLRAMKAVFGSIESSEKGCSVKIGREI